MSQYGSSQDNNLAKLRRALESIVGRRVSDSEIRRLAEAIAKAKGAPVDRVFGGLSEAANESERSVRQKAAASDDTDRAIKDLATIIDQL